MKAKLQRIINAINNELKACLDGFLAAGGLVDCGTEHRFIDPFCWFFQAPRGGSFFWTPLLFCVGIWTLRSGYNSSDIFFTFIACANFLEFYVAVALNVFVGSMCFAWVKVIFFWSRLQRSGIRASLTWIVRQLQKRSSEVSFHVLVSVFKSLHME